MLENLDVELIPGDLASNYQTILEAMLLLSERGADEEEMEEVEKNLLRRVPCFHVTTSENKLETRVGQGKFKSAALILYFVEKYQHNPVRLSVEDTCFVREYFPADIINDALNNGQTSHTTVRALLSFGPVEVGIVSCQA